MGIGCNFTDENMYINKKDYHFNWITDEEERLLKKSMPCYEHCRLCKGELKEVLKELKSQNAVEQNRLEKERNLEIIDKRKMIDIKVIEDIKAKIKDNILDEPVEYTTNSEMCAYNGGLLKALNIIDKYRKEQE